jgi:hypothetical protein
MRLALTLAALCATFSASAALADNSVGCGLGNAVTNKNSFLASTTRSYTNATFSPPTAMTSGTSGCAKHTLVLNERKRLEFVAHNYDLLLSDVAKGGGEYVDAYARTLGCDAGATVVLRKALRANFARLATGDAAPEGFLQTTRTVLRSDAVLSRCEAALI